MPSHAKKIWIDLDNSPHVPFFRPIIEEINKYGHQTILTARNAFQVCELADLFNLRYQRIGRHYGKNKILKVAGVFFRALQLAPTLLSQKPHLALSHGSRSQALLAPLIGIPSVNIYDYEHTKGLPFFYPTWTIVPEVVYNNALMNFRKDIFKYPGIKEDVYVLNFKPNSRILSDLSVNGEDLVVIIRPPATEAHYHNPKSEELFEAVINWVGNASNSRLIVIPRQEMQRSFVVKKWPRWCTEGKILIPAQVVDGLNLIWHSDLVISGGGTMNREAAALGVPVYSIFRGKIGAVDKYLADNRRLTLLESIDDVYTKIALIKRHRPAKPEHTNPAALQSIVGTIIAILEKIP
jgi:predicted glycosyltransferase